jgi:hypothetical protein
MGRQKSSGSWPNFREESVKLGPSFIEENAGELEQMRLCRVVRLEMRTWEIRRLCVEREVHEIPFLGLRPRKGLAVR